MIYSSLEPIEHFAEMMEADPASARYIGRAWWWVRLRRWGKEAGWGHVGEGVDGGLG